MKKIAIVGFGRFGELLADLSKVSFDVHIVESNTDRCELAVAQGFKILPFTALAEVDYIYLATPISKLEETIIALAPLVRADQLVIDVCSVKVYPSKLMTKYLKGCQLLATHPMFGPDSAKKGLEGLQVALCPLRIDPVNLTVINNFWLNHKISLIETSPEMHDKDTAYSQAFTYTVAKIITLTKVPSVTFKTRSFKAITEVAALSANDSEQLFHDMLYYNPYFPHMKSKLEDALRRTQTILSDIKDEQSSSKLF